MMNVKVYAAYRSLWISITPLSLSPLLSPFSSLLFSLPPPLPPFFSPFIVSFLFLTLLFLFFPLCSLLFSFLVHLLSFHLFLPLFPSSSDYKEYHTDTTVKFVVTLSQEKMQEAERIGFHKKFKLESSLNTSNMVRDDVRKCQCMVCTDSKPKPVQMTVMYLIATCN